MSQKIENPYYYAMLRDISLKFAERKGSIGEFFMRQAAAYQDKIDNILKLQGNTDERANDKRDADN